MRRTKKRAGADEFRFCGLFCSCLLYYQHSLSGSVAILYCVVQKNNIHFCQLSLHSVHLLIWIMHFTFKFASQKCIAYSFCFGDITLCINMLKNKNRCWCQRQKMCEGKERVEFLFFFVSDEIGQSHFSLNCMQHFICVLHTETKHSSIALNHTADDKSHSHAFSRNEQRKRQNQDIESQKSIKLLCKITAWESARNEN